MKVRILKDGTRCDGEVYNADEEITCKPEQAAKLIALGRASEINTRGSRKTADQDTPSGDDTPESDDNDN